MARLIEPTFALLAHKMWSGSVPDVTFEQFMERVAQLPEFMGGIVSAAGAHPDGSE